MSKGKTVKKLFVLGSVVSGAVAAYLMYKRGTPILTIAKRTVTNPIGALVGELRGAQ